MLDRDTVFVSLTRPQMFAGVTYSFFVTNAVIATELFLVFRSVWAIAVAILLHVTGILLCSKEPRTFDLWLARLANCPRIKNYGVWGCNSYRA